MGEMEETEAPAAGRRLKFLTRRGAIRLGILLGVAILLCFGAWSCMIRMPGESHTGDLPPLTPRESELASSLRRDVEELAFTSCPISTYLPRRLRQDS